MKKPLEKTIDALLLAFQNQAEQKYLEGVQKTLVEYDYLDIRDPEEFDLLMFSTLKEQEGIYASLALATVELEPKRKHRLEFIYTSYDFVMNHLEGFIEEKEGLVCSSDKSRWLLNGYRAYFINGIVEEIPALKERKFWHPKFGEAKDWFSWIDTFYDLYHGEITGYVDSKEKLVIKCTQIPLSSENT